jgi:transposase
VASPLIRSIATRHPHDLAVASKRVQWQLRVRRFRCMVPDCPRKIFTERLSNVLGCFKRRTARLTKRLRDIAFALGGEAGARLAAKEGLLTSPDTLLRLIRSTPAAVTATLRMR